ncbi:MAG: hypothetical protein U9R49_07390, partial [Bacteroidota bacterium]|nr:hypothetical protein [Bacteroidota bacterium]
GVGSGTTIENVEIVSNQDDGIEWFGGAVSVSNVVVWNTGDDAIDTDQAWSGTLDNFVIVNPGDECFELDGGEGNFNNMHTITNGSVSAQGAEGLADLDDKGAAGTVGNSYVDMSNIYFFDVSYGQDFDDNPADLTAAGFELTVPSDTLEISDFFVDGVADAVTIVADGANTVGADMTKFTDWSWAAVSGALDGF